MEDLSSSVSSEFTTPLAFHSLDPRAIKLWRTAEQIAIAVIMIPALIGVLVGSYFKPQFTLWLVLAWVVITALWLWLSIWHAPRRYQAWGYRLDDKVLETRSGRLFQITRLLPLNRLQHVDLQRGPLERTFGLARLILHTAGTEEATITIPGLAAADATRLRDQLVALGGLDAN